MAFHKSNYGSYGVQLPSDLDGYVPEPGDKVEDFCWDAATVFNEESWEDFVVDIQTAIEDADAALGGWRNG